jgi:L-threonylcarbamoyladenylate synthase
LRKILLPKSSEKLQLQKVAFDLVEKMRNGDLVAFSTENSYVVAADPHNQGAVSSFRELKGHDPKTIYPVFVNSIEDLQPFTTDVSDKTRLLTQEFWPGMLNLVLSTREVPPHNFGGTDTPDRLIARKPKNALLNLVTELVGPVIYSSLKDEKGAVIKDLANMPATQKKKIAIAIDNGHIKSSKTTTVLNCMNQRFILDREGSISLWDLKKVVSEIKES